MLNFETGYGKKCCPTEQQYRKLHADVWPEVVTAVKKANIQNYNIFIFEMGGKNYLFSYMEYTGTDPARRNYQTRQRASNGNHSKC